MENEYISIVTNDFLKNAGIVGMVCLLEQSSAMEGQDYFIHDNVLEVRREFLLKADLTQMYFDTFVTRFYNTTNVYQINERIEQLLNYENSELNEKSIKNIQEGLGFISDKLSAASYKTGINSIKEQIQNLSIYERATKKDFKKQEINEYTFMQLRELKEFLKEPAIYETLCMKSIIYNHINKFWERSFLLRNNAKKDMKECFENDFVLPLKNYLKMDKTKLKDTCIDCDNFINNKTSVPMSFIKDFADDLTRKKSALYNFNVDMNLCPICTFIYSLCPLGFVKYGNDYLFFNNNDSIEELLDNNNFYGEHHVEEVKENEKINKYYKIYRYISQLGLNKKADQQLNNVQVITRKMVSSDKVKYEFDILDAYLIALLINDKIQKRLDELAKSYVVKIENNFINVFDEVIYRMLNKRNLYDLLNLLIKENISTNQSSFIYHAKRINSIQFIMNGGNKMADLFYATKDGKELRNKLSQIKGDTNIDESMRGTFYQLTNALKVNNLVQFMDICIRLYTMASLPISTSLPKVLQSENGQDIAYSFLLGLKGAFYESNDNNKEEQ